MTKITHNGKKIAKMMSLLAAMGVILTAAGMDESFAFSLSEPTQSNVEKNTIMIAADNAADCDVVGDWNQYQNVCVVPSKVTLGVNDILVVQPDATLEVSNSGSVTTYGTIQNEGTINNHGRVFNYGVVDNLRVINNDGLVENYWGKIVNQNGALLINGGYMIDGQIGLRFVGTIDNHFGSIVNNGTISNHSIVNNIWGSIVNNCLGKVLGAGHLIGNDVVQMDCVVILESSKLQG